MGNTTYARNHVNNDKYIHNFQFFISPLEMGKKEIFITAIFNMSFMLLRNAIRLPGSGPKGLEEEQIFWFGHP